MPGRHHVLLIGIDAYDGGGMLTGCVNDIDVVQRVLIDRVGVLPGQIKRLAAPRMDAPHETDVPEELPTLANMRAAFTHLGGDEVSAQDRVFIYYSGHGTQCLVATSEGRRFSREALLPKDKKSGAEYRLFFDWEVNTLIARIAARAHAVTVILDCCCAAGATRGIAPEVSGNDRFWPTPEVYELSAGEGAGAGPIRGVAAALGGVQRCQVVSACRDDQRARESVGDGERAHGELTRALVTRLMEVPKEEIDDLRWGRIWRPVESAVREANSRQSPWLSGTFGRRVFGFGPDEDADPGFAIVQVPSGYRVDVGTLAGVTAGAEIGVYGPDPASFPKLGSPEDLAVRKGKIRVTRAERAACHGVAAAPFVLPEAPRGRLVRAGEASRLRVALSPEDRSVTETLKSSSLVELVGKDDAELTLVRLGSGGWALVDDIHGTGEVKGEPVLAVVPSDRLHVARDVIEHYHDYVTPLRMGRMCRDLPSQLRMWLLDCGNKKLPAAEAQDPNLPELKPGEHAPYEMADGGGVAIAVENTAAMTLYVSLFDCAASGRVLLLGEKAVPKRSKHVFWLNDTLGEPIMAFLAEDRDIGVERLVAIATTRPDAPLKYLTRAKSFAELIEPRRRGLRSASEEIDRGATEPEEAWTSAITALRVVRAPAARVPLATTEQLLGASVSDDERRTDTAILCVRVVNGDLSFVREPLLLGHYRSSSLTRAGAEKVVNDLIGGAMAVSLAKGQYPDPPGSHQVFINMRASPDDPLQLPRPEAVIIVGLGEEGKLQPADLVGTVKHGVIAWAQRVSERRDASSTFELAATLIGSGGISMSAGQSAQLVVQGVREANEVLAISLNSGCNGTMNRAWPHVGRLSLIELYLDRATEAWRALQMTTHDTERGYDLEAVIASAPGALPRPLDSSYRGADYDFIRAATQNGPDGESIAYTLDTKRARTETRAQAVQAALLGSLISEAADDRSQDFEVRRTLFRLLVPVDLEPFLTGDTEVQFEVDSGTAGIPWELLDDARSERSGEERVPWAIRTKLLRKLRTSEFRPLVVDADTDASALVIGEPECDPKFYPPLMGARQEALAVRSALVSPGALRDDQVLALTSKGDGKPSGPNSRTVINALMQRDWRIVHIAGHGEPPELLGPEPAMPNDPPQQLGNPRGVVLSNKVYLSPREIKSMRTIPELVFVNCCYLAARDVRQLFTKEQSECEPRYVHDRPKFASGVADALIKEGVRCVIAAGWAVEDEQAMVFARTFYQRLLAGDRFIDAVAAARTTAWRLGGNTWAAYQCYGDPDWVFRRGSDAQGRMVPIADPDAGIASARGLVLTLRTIGVQCEFQKMPKDMARQRIAKLEQRFEARWGHLGLVAESFAVGCAKAGDEQTAIRWYTRALRANDGGASIKALEQRTNLQVRLAWKAVEKALKVRDALTRKQITTPQEMDAANGTLYRVIAEAKPTIKDAIKVLQQLVEIEASMERASLLGSAYKRQALIAETEGDASVETTAIESMKRYYEQAETFGRDNKIEGFYYPALNRLSAEFALGTGPVRLDPQVVEAIRADLDASVRENAEFWNVVSQTELRVYEALSRGTLAADVPNIIAAYDDLYLRIQQDWMWSSVYDQATFVLPKYSRWASREEGNAAARLIDHLSVLSGRS